MTILQSDFSREATMFTFRTLRSLLLGAIFLAFGATVGALHAATAPAVPTSQDRGRTQ